MAEEPNADSPDLDSAATKPDSGGPGPSTPDTARETPVSKMIRLRVRRQDALDRPQTARWERFDVPWKEHLTVSGALWHVRRSPQTAEGQPVSPVAWEGECLDGSCGGCSMLINGHPELACSARIDRVSPKGKRITVEPLNKFPLVRDLVVDRSRMDQLAARTQAWLQLDQLNAEGSGAPEAPEAQAQQARLSRCIQCGACLQACPQYGEHSDFVGPAALNELRYLNNTPVGRVHRTERLERVMGPGGVADCGKAQNCVEVCPVQVPLVDSIQVLARQSTKRLLVGWLLG